MVIENLQKSDIKTIGDIEQIKTSIDVKNINFITTLLSSNLYSNPIGSFLREIVSNAWDSHVEAENTDEPVIVKLSSKRIIIRDYGTGLSEEDFKDLYCKIGSSTKRESNKYIGAFGIGHYSSVAVSDVVYINNYYNGKCSKYVMIKENGNITTNKLNTLDTEEHNGLEITVEIKPDQSQTAIKEILNLVFFPNVYVDYGDLTPLSDLNINRAKIIRYKNFSVSSVLKYTKWNGHYSDVVHRLWILLGNVLYPLEVSRLNHSCNEDQLRNLRECNICLNIPIGDISVTPNREAILYNEDTIKVLSKKLQNAVDEIEGILKSKSIIDTDDLDIYYTYLNSDKYWNPINDEVTNFRSDSWKFNVSITYKGIKRDTHFNSAVLAFNHRIVPGFKNIVFNGTFYTEKGISWRSRELSRINGAQFIEVEGNKNLKGYTKAYVNSHSECHGIPIIWELSKDDFINNLISGSAFNCADKSKIDSNIIYVAEEYYNRVKSRTTVLTAKQVNEYKEECKKNMPKGKNTDNSLYTLHEYGYESYECTDKKLNKKPVKFDEIIKLLQKQGKCILHGGKDLSGVENAEYEFLNLLGYKIIWCSASLYQKLVKYILNRSNPKHLNNVVVNRKTILENYNKSIECMLLVANISTTNLGTSTGSESLLENMKEISSLIQDPELVSYIKESAGIITRLRTLRLCSYYMNNFKGYIDVHTPTAKWLYNSLLKLTTLATEYYNFKQSMKKESINTIYVVRDLSLFHLGKWCARHGLSFNIANYRKLQSSSLINLLYKKI